jgi:5-formyltetrahydrofolate cyclo-ligase
VTTTTDQAKQAVRERVWSRLEQAGAVAPGVHGRIPAFTGADQAAQRLTALPAWQDAQVIKAVPDKAQLPVRIRALEAGKLLYMAVPRLAEELPFYLLDPASLNAAPAEAATSQGAARLARKIGVDQMRPVDLVVCGSVAANHKGVRLGKGAGYSDIEVALLAEAGLLSQQAVIVTTMHELQVLDEELPEDDHDFRVDLIATPQRVIECGPAKRPGGLSWDSLPPDKIAAIPVLAQMSRTRR